MVGCGEVGMQYLSTALEFAGGVSEQVRIYTTLINQHTLMGNFSRAIAVSVQALNKLGMYTPEPDQGEKLNKAARLELESCVEKMKDKSFAELFELPLMEDEKMRACTQILSVSLNAGVLRGSVYWQIYASRITEISMKYGISEYTTWGYSVFSYVYSRELRDYRRAYELTNLAYKVNQEKAPLPGLTPILMIGKLLYFSLGESVEQGRGAAMELFHFSREVGDAISASYSIYWVLYYQFPLNVGEVIILGDKHIGYNIERNDVHVLNLIRPRLGLCHRLRDGELNTATTTLNYADFDEDEFLKNFADDSIKLSVYYENKLIIIVMTEQYDEAIKIIETRNEWGEFLNRINPYYTGEITLFLGITACNLMLRFQGVEKFKHEEMRTCLAECISGLEELAEINKPNFEHGYYILEARNAQLENRPVDAMQFFERATESARRYGYTQNEYLANKLAGDYCLELGLEMFAALYFSEALYAAGRWDAGALEKNLEKKYGDLIRKVTYTQGLSSGNTVTTVLSSGTSSTGATSGASYRSGDRTRPTECSSASVIASGGERRAFSSDRAFCGS